MGKKAPAKVPVAKVVWEWTENTSPNDITELHLHTAYRLLLGKCKTCRKNCSGNPLCLRGLGEGVWLREGNYESTLQRTIEELNSAVRKEDEFVGLKNLGATCYVNTFLQLWFHNLDFRKAVYSFHEDVKRDENPDTVCGHLQLLFGMLQSSIRKCVDPTAFVKRLGLDADVQQDAQEFSKLLLNVMGQSAQFGDFLRSEFCGEYEYCTKCNTCGNLSKCSSEFYELDLTIRGQRNIMECLKEFFKDEQLTDENQYNCVNCARKQDASRRIVVKSLPRTLSLQLLRFVFDKSTCKRKKLSNYITFPDTIDMSQFVNLENGMYDLTAVLIHRGPSALSGHYIAHIKDPVTDLWCKFNDEAIELVKSGKKLALSADAQDDYQSDMPQPAKKHKLMKNTHSSKDAYMLVYTKRSLFGHINAPPSIPDVVRNAVEKDNENFRDFIDQKVEDARKKMLKEMELHQKMRTHLKRMHDADATEILESYYWVPAAWLKSVLDASQDNKNTFSMEKFLCNHGKLNPDKVSGLKCIPSAVANLLFRMCSTETPRLGKDALCYNCVEERCFLLRIKDKLKHDHATVNKLLKEGENALHEGFLIGRYSLRCWKAMALQQIEIKVDGMWEVKKNVPEAEILDEIFKSNKEESDFNEDLLCEHGNVSADSKQYRIISSVVWNIITKYFPGTNAYESTNFTKCATCRENKLKAEQTTKLEKSMILQQKTHLRDLLHNKNRPCYKDLCDNGNVLYAVSSEFVKSWREFIHNSSNHEAVLQVENKLLLCRHEKLICNPLISLNDFPERFQRVDADRESELSAVPLWPAEWNYLCNNFTTDIAITIARCNEEAAQHWKSKNVEDKPDDFSGELKNTHKKAGEADLCTQNGENISLFASNRDSDATAHITEKKEGNSLEQTGVFFRCHPEMCRECMLGRELEKERQRGDYKNGIIYIRKVFPDKDSSWIQKVAAHTIQHTQMYNRRSKRAHRTLEDKKLVVSSEWSLKRLKIEIMKVFLTPPFDQNIWFNGKNLKDDNSTLGELSIMPGSTVLFVADEPDEKLLDALPVIDEKQALEEGFRGTSLLSV